MAVRKKAYSRLNKLREGYPLAGGKVVEAPVSSNVKTDTTLSNMSFARTMAGPTNPTAGGPTARAVRERVMTVSPPPARDTAAVRREVEQSEEGNVIRNPGRVSMPDYKGRGHRESTSDKKKKKR